MAKATTTANETDVDVPEPKPAIILTRDQIRAAMFESEHALAKAIPIQYLGADLEWRNPTIRQMQELRDQEDKNFMVLLLIGYTFIPGTDEKIFEDTDYDRLVDMPIHGDFQKVVNTIAATIDLNVEEKVKN